MHARHITSYFEVSFHLISHNFRVTPYHIPRITSHHTMTSYHIMSHTFMLHRNHIPRIIRHITSHHIISYHLISHHLHITSYQIPSMTLHHTSKHHIMCIRIACIISLVRLFDRSCPRECTDRHNRPPVSLPCPDPLWQPCAR